MHILRGVCGLSCLCHILCVRYPALSTVGYVIVKVCMASRGLLDLYARGSRYTTRRSRVGVSNHSSVQINKAQEAIVQLPCTIAEVYLDTPHL